MIKKYTLSVMLGFLIVLTLPLALVIVFFHLVGSAAHKYRHDILD